MFNVGCPSERVVAFLLGFAELERCTMEKHDFSFNFEELVSDTLLLTVNVLDLYGPCRKGVVDKWKETFANLMIPNDGFNDWGQVRNLFWSKIQQQVMTDDDFLKAIGSILIELYGQKEGMRGLVIIFAPPFRFK